MYVRACACVCVRVAEIFIDDIHVTTELGVDNDSATVVVNATIKGFPQAAVGTTDPAAAAAAGCSVAVSVYDDDLGSGGSGSGGSGGGNGGGGGDGGSGAIIGKASAPVGEPGGGSYFAGGV